MVAPRTPGINTGATSADAAMLNTASAYGLPTGTLRRGSSGSDVRALQEALNRLGANLTVDGIFGPATESAVKALQRSAGITVDGIYGTQTRTAISSGARVEGGGSTTSGSTSSYSGGGSTSSGGGGSTSSSTSTSGGGPGDRLPGGYSVWKINGVLHVVYEVEGASAPMAWRIDGDASTVIGSQAPSRTLSGTDAAKLGVLVMGRHSDLRTTGDDPLGTFAELLEERAKVEPWLKDPEVMAQAAEAFLEQREMSIADLRETDWYNSRTQKERDWIARAAQMSPEDVARSREDRRIEVRNMLLKAGVSDPPASLVNWIAEKDLTGQWSDVKLAQQITALGDPYSGEKLDRELRRQLEGLDLVTRASDTRAVREQAKEWLGPFADGYSDRQLEQWAGMLRNDPNGATKLEDIFRRQRLAMLPEYDNPDVRWADASAPWRAYLQQQWGEPVAEDDPLLMQVVRANDVNTAGRLAREEGIKRGVGGAVNQVTDALSQAFGGTVRRSIQ